MPNLIHRLSVALALILLLASLRAEDAPLWLTDVAGEIVLPIIS